MRQITGDVALGGSPFPPIAEYGFLSDGEVIALVAPSGGVEWLCLPRMDSPSVFGALLDRDAGAWRLSPADTTVPTGRRYIPGTNILETTWATRTGWVIVRDLLLVGPWHHDDRRSDIYRRAPGDHEAEHVLLRTLRCVNGSVEMVMDCSPRPQYGRVPVRWEYRGDGYGCGVARTEGRDFEMTLTTDLRLGFEGGHAGLRTTMHDGELAFMALSWNEHQAPQDFADAYARVERTADYWHEWLARGQFPDHPWRAFLQRSALTLKGLTYTPTGAMIAAATTSLPETPQGERNWDYRYSWVRDSTFALWGLYSIGFNAEADAFFAFITDAIRDGRDLQVMYGIGGETELDEHELGHLSGYDDARPVRIGNGAYDQKQHDVWGAFLDSVYLHTKSRDEVPEQTWPLLTHQVECAVRHWREPDRGIWEVRGEPQHFVSSKVMCWVACDRGARLARLRRDEEKEERWQGVADEIHADVLEHGVDDRGVFTQHYDTDALDASNLLIPLVRFLPPNDPRVVATVDAIGEELTEHGLVRRYLTHRTDDGLSGEEGTFAICSFWMVSALAEIGETARARALCERLLSYASPLQLYAEEIDAASGRHLGNFPQAFTHLALINAVMHVIRADQAAMALNQPLDAARDEHEAP